MPFEIVVTRDIAITLAPAARNLQGLIDELTLLLAEPNVGPNAVVAQLSGSTDRFKLQLLKPN